MTPQAWPFQRLLLGSTIQALIAHAPCPVAVVRDHLNSHFIRISTRLRRR
jgi:hypothetical protein